MLDTVAADRKKLVGYSMGKILVTEVEFHIGIVLVKLRGIHWDI